MKYIKTRVFKLAIPDDNPSGVSDTITIPRNLTVRKVQVEVELSHSYAADLAIELTSPEGMSTTLEGPGKDEPNWSSRLFEGGSLDKFIGQKSGGAWTLKIIDTSAQDSGEWHSWCLHLEMANSKKSSHLLDAHNPLTSAQVCHEDGVISDAELKLDVDNPSDANISATLEHPSGQTVIIDVLDESAKYRKELKALIGLHAKGTWKLHLSKNAHDDKSPRLRSWKLNLSTQNNY